MMNTSNKISSFITSICLVMSFVLIGTHILTWSQGGNGGYYPDYEELVEAFDNAAIALNNQRALIEAQNNQLITYISGQESWYGQFIISTAAAGTLAVRYSNAAPVISQWWGGQITGVALASNGHVILVGAAALHWWLLVILDIKHIHMILRLMRMYNLHGLH